MPEDDRGFEEEYTEKVTETEMDSIRIAPDVIGIIAGLVAGDIEGVAGMSGGIVGGIAERLGRRDFTRGIKVHLEEDRVKLDLNIIVEMGVKIVDVANHLKQEIRATVENVTGLQVAAINVNVLGSISPGSRRRK